MTHKRNWIFVIGTVLIILGAGVSTFGTFFLFFYLIPLWVFLAGVILIWLSKRKYSTKVLWTLTPIIVFAAFQFAWYKILQVPPETFLIPENYRGKVQVIFNEPCGAEPVIENGRRIYQIPPTGILITRFEAKYGFIDQQFYLITSDGKRILLPQMDTRDFNEQWTLKKNLHEPSRDSLGVFNAVSCGTGSFANSKEFNYEQCFVGTYRQITSLGSEYDQKFDSLEEKLLKQCRQKK